MAAVQDPPVDEIIQAPHRIVQFAAYRGELVLVHTPTYDILGPQGNKTGKTTDGVRVRFEDGMLRVPEEGHIVTEQGRKFDAPEMLEWLRDHRLNGNRDEGFWEVPMAAPPVSEAELEAVTGASIRADIRRLKSLLEAEERGWKRGELMRPIQKAIAAYDEYMAEMNEQAEAREADEAKQPAAKKPAARKA